MISPSLEPNQHTPMLIGYLKNADEKYLVGQFVTATIKVPPPPDTVEIPTDAINPLQGQNLVFVKKAGTENQFVLRRIAVAQSARVEDVEKSTRTGLKSYKNVSLVRAKLTEEDEKLSREEAAKGRYIIQPLEPGEHVITRGVVELTEAWEDLITQRKDKDKAADGKD
jgi:cobalt-zinc-cadmium efflux system membrane fusion protein